MSISNRSHLCRCIELIAWPAIIAMCASPVLHAGEEQQSTVAEKSAAAEHQATKSRPDEGRQALEFYSTSKSSQAVNDAWRLADQVRQYPVDPVERLDLLLELGDPFLGNGPIRPGIKTPFGQMLQPGFLLYGSFRTALQSFERHGVNSIEWSNRLDLNGNVNLSGTERLVFSMRPLDSQTGNFTGYNFQPNDNSGWHEDFNARLTRLFFEGDLGEIFPGLDPDDSHTYDLGFSIGRQRMTVQDGLLLNDLIDAVGITRNSLVFDGISNLRLTGIYGWNHINRGNNDVAFQADYHSVKLFGLLAEADTAWNNTVSLDALYVGGDSDENAWYFGAASTQRFGWLNSTFRVNASIPAHESSSRVGSGVLLVSQLSSTLPSSDNLLYFNSFWNIGRFTSAGRSPDQGSPVANLGLLYGPVGMGRYGVPLGEPIDHTVGTAIGYQMFFDGINSQLIFEVGARANTQNRLSDAALGFGTRFQKSFGKRHVLRLDAFVATEEHQPVSYGLRTEWMIKF